MTNKNLSEVPKTASVMMIDPLHLRSLNRQMALVKAGVRLRSKGMGDDRSYVWAEQEANLYEVALLAYELITTLPGIKPFTNKRHAEIIDALSAALLSVEEKLLPKEKPCARK